MTPEQKKERNREYQRRWIQANPERLQAIKKRYTAKPEVKASRRDRQREYRAKDSRYRDSILKQYGMTQEDWLVMFEAQDRRCAVCRTDTAKKWNTDHCHRTGLVRGILCRACNTGLGHFRDEPATLRVAALYLEKA